MIDPFFLIQGLTLLLGFYMAWNIGANDVSNAMGTLVGSKALSLRHAVILAAIFEFCGAYFLGSDVCETIQKGIVDPTLFAHDPLIFVLGMMGALLATGAALQIASYFGLPVSTTHAIVGAVLGFGLIASGSQAVHWGEMGWIVSSWLLSPFLSGIISYALFSLIQRKVLYALNPIEAAKKLAPILVFFCILVVGLSLTSLSYAISIASLAAIAFHFFLRKVTEPTLQPASGFNPYQRMSLEKALHHLQRVQTEGQSYSAEISSVLGQLQKLHHTVKQNTSFSHCTTQYQGVENIFVFLQILSACLVAFAHGANDVANAIGPVAAVLATLKTGAVTTQTAIPSWLLLLGGAGIVIGLATWGWRVIETVGRKITELTPTRGFAAEFSAAATILLASKLGLPISTTHALIGAVFGVGLARGLKALNLSTIKEIIISWIITIPFCATLSILAFYLLKAIFT